MKIRLILLISCFVLYEVCDGKVFTRCQLSKELVRTGMIQRSFLGTWACLIEKVSNRNITALSVSPSGKQFYGLYQIPSNWCKPKKRGGDCNIRCEDLLDDDIRDDTACALQIQQKEGFKYWSVWNTRCKNDNFITNEIFKCPDLRLGLDRSSPDNLLLQRQHSIRKGSTKQSLRSIVKRSILRILINRQLEDTV